MRLFTNKKTQEETISTETPEQKKAREKEEKRKASLVGALKSYETADESVKKSLIKAWTEKFNRKFSQNAKGGYFSETTIKYLMEQYGEKNMEKFFLATEVLYNDLFQNNHINDLFQNNHIKKNLVSNIFFSYKGLSQAQINLITEENLQKWKEILNNNSNDQIVIPAYDPQYNWMANIIPLKTLITRGDTLYRVRV